MLPVPAQTVGGGDIFDTIQRGNIDQCADIIQLDRSTLRQKGWGGFTPLHYTAYQGNRALTELLLSNGADPNTPCDTGLTPFHFACRNGNVSIMHQMLQHGADVQTVDHQGKTALHHSVAGGNVLAIQYLNETGMFRFADTDRFQLTPLHLAASTGNSDVVRYLLRNDRCAADAADQQGATPLHVAAEKGAVEVSWLLLREAGLRILHLRNRQGLTPYDLCRQGTTYRHQQLTQILKKFINEPTDQKPKESYGMYYWTLLFPSVSGAVILLIAARLGGYGGVFCALLFPWLARSILSQYHRINSHQGLPNPVYVGTLTAGIFHTSVCFYYKILPNIWPAPTLLHVSIVHFSAVLWLFRKVLTKNPGQLQPEDADPRFSSIMSLVEANESSRFCIYCEIFQPDSCKHCRLCNMCMLDYDHHCLFLNQCVGRGNHRLFLFFILSMAAAHLVFLYAAGCYLLARYAAAAALSRPAWGAVVGAEAWVLVLTAMNALTFAWECWLLAEQFEAVSMGTTTYFKRGGRSQRPLWRRWRTAVSFLLEGKRPRPPHGGVFQAV
ncbi:palmitoyltransferase ZDHHC13 [Anguilla anguilla]|uniref:palmitoyltransferase ZDHHC13 n=1 Tax=Anguilla anguilla TaxID=7936 RepID=UPI0015B33C47|nr:palmitoyltransferase ZDHHC13 [Anguilla anguilla]